MFSVTVSWNCRLVWYVNIYTISRLLCIFPLAAVFVIHTLTNCLTRWNRVLLEKLIVIQLLKKSPALYGTPGFIILFTPTRHRSLSRARRIQSATSHPVSLRSILILSPHLRPCVPSGLFLQVFGPKFFIHFSSAPCLLLYPPSHSPLFGKAYKLWSSPLCSVLHTPTTSRS
jgi:hypothetical protein